MADTYTVNECFYSLQGEGVRAGTANVFVRFTGCNLKCRVEPGPLSPGGFDCDTEFAGGRKVTAAELLAWIAEEQAAAGAPAGGWIIATGGEPALQLDAELCSKLHEAGYKIAVETNGSKLLPLRQGSGQPVKGLSLDQAIDCFAVDWITVSPKVAEHAVRQLWAHEVKYVRGHGQALPKPSCFAVNHVLSPAFDGDQIDQRALAWCMKLCRENPQWRLSCQLHKAWVIR